MKLTTAMIVAGLMVVTAPPARAEHNSAAPPERATEHGTRIVVPGTDQSLDVTLKLGVDGFRLRGRLFDQHGYVGGAWLDGETRRNGFRLDGRVEHDGMVRDFTLEADLEDWARRLMRWGDGTLEL